MHSVHLVPIWARGLQGLISEALQGRRSLLLVLELSAMLLLLDQWYLTPSGMILQAFVMSPNVTQLPS